MTILWFLLALFILITIHEYGHFIVARLCGVKVLRFSFGFGKVLWSWRGKKGTEYAISMLPLGGYVKMLDEREGPVPKNALMLAFNNQSLGKRIAIVAAGPLFNLLFAVLCFWLVFMIGMKSIAPVIDQTLPDSLASKAGFKPQDEIVSVNNQPVSSWQGFQYALIPWLGSGSDLPVQVKSRQTAGVRPLHLSLQDWSSGEKKQDLLTSLGIVPFFPTLPLIVEKVVDNSPAQLAGIEPGDRIETLNGKRVKSWMAFVSDIQNKPGTWITLSVLHENVSKTLKMKTGIANDKGFIGLGIRPLTLPSEWLRHQRQGPLQALGSAISQTSALTASTFVLFTRLVTGQLTVQALTGPVGIAKGAGQSARNGFVYYLSFLGIVSISLGALNLLPVPILDGGHLFYYLIEFIKGKPLSQNVQDIGYYLSLLFLGAMLAIALFNDIYRLAD